MNTAYAGAVLYHIAESPHARLSYDVSTSRRALEWLAAAPRPLYGEVVSATGPTPELFAMINADLDDGDLADAATLANCMATGDSEWDRDTRRTRTRALAEHTEEAARMDAQSSAEFAAVDSLVEAGFESLDHAMTAVAELRRVCMRKFRYLTRQFKRSRYAIACEVEVAPRQTYHILTPWCLSRQSANAYVAVLLRDFWRTYVEKKVVARARTVTSYAARAGLEAVRSLLRSAISIVCNYRYDPARLAFVDSFGTVTEPITVRSPATTVAFAALFMSGNGDVNMDLATLRIDNVPEDSPYLKEVELEYEPNNTSEFDCLMVFSRLLRKMRVERDISKAGPRINKDPMLAYIARGRSKTERNTAACVNRVEEAAALCRSKGVNVNDTIFVVEWGGEFDHAVVLASLAIAKLDVCLDIGMSGVDVPGQEVLDDERDGTCNYQLLLASARERHLPRMPRLPYSASESLDLKLRRVQDFYDKSGTSKIVYVSGGMTASAGTPVSICDDARARIMSIVKTAEEVPIIFGCAEALIPPLCHHADGLSIDEYLECESRVVDDCLLCTAHRNSISAFDEVFYTDNVRIVKPRSSYAHNGHVSLEFVPGHHNPFGDTEVTIRSMVAANILRNHPWPSEPHQPPPPNAGNPTHTEVAELMRPLVKQAYETLGGSPRDPTPYEDLESVAASIT